MLCEKPYVIGSMPCPCQQCFPCRINRRRLWAHRLDLESQMHGDSSFVTLTYDDEHLPLGGSLAPDDPQKWLKRLRKVLAPEKVRYFLAGEYGPETFRPHYHAAIFGLAASVAGGVDGCAGVVRDTWNLGNTFVGPLSRDGAMYVAGYVTKKMTQGKDKRLNGKYPEFSRMSLRPGIGAPAVPDIARVLDTPFGMGSIDASGDVPVSLQYGRSNVPLGRYLRVKLREALGYAKETPREVLKAYEERMHKLLQDALKNPKIKASYEKNRKGLFPRDAVGNILVDKFKNKRDHLKVRYGIFAQKETL